MNQPVAMREASSQFRDMGSATSEKGRPVIGYNVGDGRRAGMRFGQLGHA